MESQALDIFYGMQNLASGDMIARVEIEKWVT